MLRCHAVAREPQGTPFDIVVLAADERHLRRKVLTLQHGDKMLVDLPETVMLSHGDRLVLDDGRNVEVIAAEEALIEACGRDAIHLIELAWHLGNRHLPAQVEAERILVGHDHVIRDMLIGLGARVRDVSEPFHPVRGAYHSHGGGHGGGHGHEHGHAHAGAHHHGDGHHHHHHTHTSHGHTHTVTESHTHRQDAQGSQHSHSRVSVKIGPAKNDTR